MGAPVPIQHDLIDLLEEINDAMPTDDECIPFSEGHFMVRMIKQWWTGPFNRKTVAAEDVAELIRLHEKYCGDPSVGPAAAQS